MELATGIILAAGTMTFANEWWQTRQVNFRIPVATLLLAAGFDGLSKLDPKISATLAVIVFIGALTTEFNGKSVASTLAGLFPAKGKPAPAKQPARMKVA
jgi:hypothetical protein